LGLQGRRLSSFVIKCFTEQMLQVQKYADSFFQFSNAMYLTKPD
jgi:hypothetical protein